MRVGQLDSAGGVRVSGAVSAGCNATQPSRRRSPRARPDAPRRTPAARRASPAGSRAPAAEAPAAPPPRPGSARRRAGRSPRRRRRCRAVPPPTCCHAGRKRPRPRCSTGSTCAPQRGERPAAQAPQHLGVAPLGLPAARAVPELAAHQLAGRRPAGPARRRRPAGPSPNRAAASAVVNGPWVRA